MQIMIVCCKPQTTHILQASHDWISVACTNDVHMLTALTSLLSASAAASLSCLPTALSGTKATVFSRSITCGNAIHSGGHHQHVQDIVYSIVIPAYMYCHYYAITSRMYSTSNISSTRPANNLLSLQAVHIMVHLHKSHPSPHTSAAAACLLPAQHPSPPDPS